MSASFRTHKVTLDLPVIPRAFRKGDKRNYRRWHCWVEAVKVLAEHFKGSAERSGGRRKG